MPFHNMAEVMQANREAGDHWFDEDTMSFFLSRIESGSLLESGKYFVTSERCPWGDSRGERHSRRYTVREARDNGTIGTVGEFQQHDDETHAWLWLEDERARGAI